MPGPRSQFDALISNPHLQSDVFGAFSGGGPGYAGGEQTNTQFPMSAPMLQSMATGQLVTQQPRHGLGALLAKTGLIGPNAPVDPQTIWLEELALQARRRQDAEDKQKAIGNWAKMVPLVGGDAALKLAPMFFGPQMNDPQFVHDMAAIHATNQIREQQQTQRAKYEQGQQKLAGRRLDIEGKRVSIEGTRAQTENIRAKTESRKQQLAALTTKLTPAQKSFEEAWAKRLANPDDPPKPDEIKAAADTERMMGVPRDQAVLQAIVEALPPGPVPTNKTDLWALVGTAIDMAMKMLGGGTAQAKKAGSRTPIAPAPGKPTRPAMPLATPTPKVKERF